MTTQTETSVHEFRAQDDQYLHLRRVAQDDTALLADLLLRLSDQTRYFRYFTARTFSLNAAWGEAERITGGQAGGQIAVMAQAPRSGGDEAIGVAELVPDARQPALGHVAVAVRDDRQRQGIGTILVRRLLDLAQESTIATLRADLLNENRAARRLLDKLGLPYESHTRHAETRVLTRPAVPAENIAGSTG